MAVVGVADKNHAGKFAVFQCQLPVDAQGGIFVTDDLGTVEFVSDFASGENIHSHDFQLRGLHTSLIFRPFVPGDRGSQHFALLDKGRHQSIANPVVLHTFPDGEDVWMRRFHVIVHHDAALEFEPRSVAQADVRANAGSDDHQIRGNAAAAFKLNAFNLFIPRIAVVLRPRSTVIPI